MTSEKNFVPLIKQTLTNIMGNRYPLLLSAIHFQYRTNYLKNK